MDFSLQAVALNCSAKKSPPSENATTVAKSMMTTIAAFAFGMILFASGANASTCYLVNNDPMAFGGHASPEIELSESTGVGAHRFVTLSSGLQIEVEPSETTSDSDAQTTYQSVDARQAVRVTTLKVGNVEREATVTIGLVLPLVYSCR